MAVAVSEVSSSEASLDLVLWSNSSTRQFNFLRYQFHFRGIAFKPMTYCFGYICDDCTSVVGVITIGVSFFS